MELALITPIQYLDYSYLLPGRFCLAHIAAKYMDYRKFFKDASYQGYPVMMDNGVFENAVLSRTRYLELMVEIQPDVIIAPDIISGDSFEGLETAHDFAEEVEETWIINVKNVSKSTPEVMFVPQCKRGQTYVFEQVLEAFLKDQSLQWLGICRDALYNAYGQFTQTKDQELNRFYFASRLQHLPVFNDLRDVGKKFHFLGVGDRVEMIQHYWFVNSMDTSAPFWQGSLGEIITNKGILTTRMKRPKDYFTRPHKLTEMHKGLIRTNCIEVAKYANMALDRRKDIEKTRL